RLAPCAASLLRSPDERPRLSPRKRNEPFFPDQPLRAGAECYAPPPSRFPVPRSRSMMSSTARRPPRRPNRFMPRFELLEDRSVPSASVPGVTLDPLAIPKFINPLPQALDPSFVYQPVGTT